jgi:hypothetical protein
VPNDTSQSSTDRLFFALGQVEGAAGIYEPEPISSDTRWLCTIIVRATVVLAEAIREAGRDR